MSGHKYSKQSEETSTGLTTELLCVDRYRADDVLAQGRWQAVHEMLAEESVCQKVMRTCPFPCAPRGMSVADVPELTSMFVYFMPLRRVHGVIARVLRLCDVGGRDGSGREQLWCAKAVIVQVVVHSPN